MAYELTASPIKVQKKFPGNIGEGISREADANSKKKASSMAAPFIFFALRYVLFLTRVNQDYPV